MRQFSAHTLTHTQIASSKGEGAPLKKTTPPTTVSDVTRNYIVSLTCEASFLLYCCGLVQGARTKIASSEQSEGAALSTKRTTSTTVSGVVTPVSEYVIYCCGHWSRVHGHRLYRYSQIASNKKELRQKKEQQK